MSYGYPDGCTQDSHDQYYDRPEPQEPDEDTISADCGHSWPESGCEWVNGLLVCPRCMDAAEVWDDAAWQGQWKDVLAVLREARGLMPLGTAIRAEWMERTGNVLERIKFERARGFRGHR